MSATLTSRPLPDLTTRRPTGKPSWPTVLLGGIEGSGKTWKAVELSTWELIGRSFFIEVGEDTADEYGAVPGADYEIVPHDGTYLGILDAVRWAVAQPVVDGKPNAIIFDSGSVLWDLIVDEQQVIANRRALAKAKRYNKPVPREDQDVTITTDQWNIAKDRWLTVINLMRRHSGPAIVCCRVNEVTKMDDSGQPTKDKEWKPACHKSFPFDANIYVQMREPYPAGRGAGTLLKARSATADLNEVDMGNDWTLVGVFKRLGLDKVVSAESTYVEPNAAAYEAEYDAETANADLAERHAEESRRAAQEGVLPDGEQIMAMLGGALAIEDPSEARRRLLQIKASFGASNLDKITDCPTKDGKVTATVAIDKALDIVKARAGGAQQATEQTGATTGPDAATSDTPAAEQPSGPPAEATAPAEPAPAAEPEPPAVEQPTADTGEQAQSEARAAAEATEPPARESNKDKMIRLGIEEVRFQAEVLGVTPRAHLGDALADGQDPRTLPPTKLGKAVRAQRAAVIEALRASGRATEADLYERIKDAFPVRMADVFTPADGAAA